MRNFPNRVTFILVVRIIQFDLNNSNRLNFSPAIKIFLSESIPLFYNLSFQTSIDNLEVMCKKKNEYQGLIYIWIKRHLHFHLYFVFDNGVDINAISSGLPSGFVTIFSSVFEHFLPFVQISILFSTPFSTPFSKSFPFASSTLFVKMPPGKRVF